MFAQSSTDGPDGPFTVAGHLPVPPVLDRAVTPLVDRVLGLRELQDRYRALPRTPGREGGFVEQALAALGVQVQVTPLAPVPASGGLLVVANHPLGALDGLAVLAAVRRVRSDVRVLGTALLARIREIRPLLVGVEIFDRAAGARANARALRAALDWLAAGGCLVTFPSGEVAYRVSIDGLGVDGPWHPHVATLAVKSRAAVIPICIEGATSRLFRTAGVVHPLLRTALLPRELLGQRGRVVRLIVGEGIEPAALQAVPEAERAPFLRARTHLLAADRRDGDRTPATAAGEPADEPIAPAVDPALLAQDVAALPAEALLVESGGLQVFHARAADLPHVLPEIGRLREITFRGVGEGTGRGRDLDRFDETYCHLFAWDPRTSRLIGAYRLGPTDEIVPRHGLAGLYTHTLFDYGRALIDEIGPAIELGRSFVRPECQREFAPLLLLWKGIGRFLARAPRYRRLFGAVSISNRYESVSRELLVRFLSAVALHPSAARLVHARQPLATRRRTDELLEGSTVRSLEGVSALVRSIERDGKGIPVLLRQYLQLNARLLGFSVDPAFGDALDGLMVVDLADVPGPMLARLLGRARGSELSAAARGAGAAAPAA